MKQTIIVVLALALAACSSNYKTERFDAPAAPLSSQGVAYVMLARDGAYGARTYAGSGRTVSENLYSAVLAHTSAAHLAKAVEAREQALTMARAKGAHYMFEPAILNWEDRATEWSGRPDRITVWDAATGRQIAASVERASSKWMTFGGDHPQDLVPKMMNAFANRVMQ